MKNYQVNPAFIVQKIGNKTGVFDAEKSMMYMLNDTAAVIFLGMQLQWEKEKIINKIVSQYQIKQEVVLLDFEEIIQDMLQKKMIVKKFS